MIFNSLPLYKCVESLHGGYLKTSAHAMDTIYITGYSKGKLRTFVGFISVWYE